MFFLLFLFVFFFIKIPAFNIISVDSDQTPRSDASDLGRHCLPMFLFGTPARLMCQENAKCKAFLFKDILNKMR